MVAAVAAAGFFGPAAPPRPRVRRPFPSERGGELGASLPLSTGAPVCPRAPPGPRGSGRAASEGERLRLGGGAFPHASLCLTTRRFVTVPWRFWFKRRAVRWPFPGCCLGRWPRWPEGWPGRAAGGLCSGRPLPRLRWLQVRKEHLSYPRCLLRAVVVFLFSPGPKSG